MRGSGGFRLWAETEPPGTRALRSIRAPPPEEAASDALTPSGLGRQDPAWDILTFLRLSVERDREGIKYTPGWN